MKLYKLISCLNIQVDARYADCEITSVCHDSRRAASGSVFVCKSGAKVDGHDYAGAAYELGARVFVAQKEISLPSDAYVIYTDDTEDALSRLSQCFYGYPQRKLKIIGITGTKGKTTLALSIYDIGKKYGLRMGYIGTNGVLYGDTSEQTANTTPDVLELQRILCDMTDNGVEYVLLEVSSQALWQRRVDDLEFYISMFTNLYEDHIGGVEHPTLEHYMSCKKKLFEDYPCELAVANLDSEYSKFMLESIESRKVIYTSASGNGSAGIYAEDICKCKTDTHLGVEFSVFGCGFEGEKIFLPFPGKYSVENALNVIAVCVKLGMEKSFIIKEMRGLVVSGRFETVTLSHKAGTLFIIDYAHNGASLSAVISALREYEPARIICLFGSVGGRTFERRIGLARAAVEADIVIVTSDNPGPECPSAVIDDICSHMLDGEAEIYKLDDREQAIKFAVEIAREGDFVLLAGKGHENYQLIGRTRVPFCERQILLDTQKSKNTLFEL